MFRQAGHIHRTDADLAGIHPDGTGDAVEQSGLSIAISTDNGDIVPLLQRQGHPLEHMILVGGTGIERLVKIGNLQHISHR